VIDAAGAIYVIGGYDGSTPYKDVWVSTDRGADRTTSGGGGGGRGVLFGLARYTSGTRRVRGKVHMGTRSGYK
jgi:hypothetical protein